MLVNRNIIIGNRRTSVRLEPEFWISLADIAQREHISVNKLCTEVDRGAGNLSRTAAIRVFIAAYMVRLAEQAAGQLRPPFVTRIGGHYEATQTDVNFFSAQRHQGVG